MQPRLAAFAVALLTGVAGCTGETGTPTPTAAPTSRTPGPVVSAECPPGPVTNVEWPKEIPEVIPRPPSVKLQGVDTKQANLVQVRFEAPMSMRDSVQFIVKEFPAAGFTLARGDTEATETDAPFSRGEALRGLVRVFLAGDCRTVWALAVVKNANAPYNLSYTPPPSSTPLPFG